MVQFPDLAISVYSCEFDNTIFEIQMQVWSSLTGKLKPYDGLDTPHTDAVIEITIYSVLWTVLYTVLCYKLYPDSQVAACNDLFLEEHPLPTPCKLYLYL